MSNANVVVSMRKVLQADGGHLSKVRRPKIYRVSILMVGTRLRTSSINDS